MNDYFKHLCLNSSFVPVESNQTHLYNVKWLMTILSRLYSVLKLKLNIIQSSMQLQCEVHEFSDC